jgi:hypothetical protein
MTGNTMTHEEIKARNEAIFTRYLRLGEFYTKKERYLDIAETHNIHWQTVRDIVLKMKKGGRR